MRVLVYTTQVRFPGGYENLALQLIQTVNSSGDTGLLLCHYPEDVKCESYDCVPRALPPQVHVQYLEVPVRPSLKDSIGAALRLRSLIRHERIDAIEASGRGPAMLASISTIGLGTRVAIGVHDVVRPGSWAHPVRLWWKLLRLARLPVFHYGVSRAASDAWANFARVKRGTVPTIYNSIGTEFFSADTIHRHRIREEFGFRPEDFVILCAGRLMRRKGQDTVVNALSPLLHANRVQLVFAGRPDTEPGDDGSHLSQLKRDIEQRSYRDRIRFIGARNDMPAVMAAADLLVHVPRREAFGMVLAEAMASGLPIIASAVDGVPEVVAGTGSVMVPPNDSKALRRAVLDVLDWPPAIRARCIRLGRAKAASFHPTDRWRKILRLLHHGALEASDTCPPHNPQQ